MEADSPAAIMGRLAEIEEQMATELVPYSEAAGWMAKWAMEERKLYLLTKFDLEQKGALNGLTTETAKKDVIENTMRRAYPDQFEEAEKMARTHAIGKALFQGLDARRSIGQSLLKIHSNQAEAERYGKGSGNDG